MLRSPLPLLFLASLALVACADYTAEEDSVMDASDSGELGSDAFDDVGSDVQDDASTLPTFETRTVLVALVRDLDTEPPNPDGLEVCVYEYLDDVTCETVADGEVEISAPVGERFHLLVRGDKMVPTLNAVNSRHSADEALLALGTPEVALNRAHDEAGTTPVDDEGTVTMVMLPDTLDPRACHDATAEVVSGTVGSTIYTDANSDFATSGAATNGQGTIGRFNVAPGELQITVSHPLSACNAGGLEGGEGVLAGAWESYEIASSFDVVVEAGMVTVAFIACDEFTLLDARECDVMGDECPAEQSKCRVHLFTSVDGEGSYGTSCSVAGDREIEETCTRVGGEAGNDDCAASLYCGNWDITPGESQVCRVTCMTGDDCAGGEVCHGFSGRGHSPGLCIPTCSPLEPR
jgi:hypothetical protein